jgi:hypothetical protein
MVELGERRQGDVCEADQLNAIGRLALRIEHAAPGATELRASGRGVERMPAAGGARPLGGFDSGVTQALRPRRTPAFNLKGRGGPAPSSRWTRVWRSVPDDPAPSTRRGELREIEGRARRRAGRASRRSNAPPRAATAGHRLERDAIGPRGCCAAEGDARGAGRGPRLKIRSSPCGRVRRDLGACSAGSRGLALSSVSAPGGGCRVASGSGQARFRSTRPALDREFTPGSHSSPICARTCNSRNPSAGAARSMSDAALRSPTHRGSAAAAAERVPGGRAQVRAPPGTRFRIVQFCRGPR